MQPSAHGDGFSREVEGVLPTLVAVIERNRETRHQPATQRRVSGRECRERDFERADDHVVDVTVFHDIEQVVAADETGFAEQLELAGRVGQADRLVLDGGDLGRAPGASQGAPACEEDADALAPFVGIAAFQASVPPALPRRHASRVRLLWLAAASTAEPSRRDPRRRE